VILVDSNIFVDIWTRDAAWGQWSTAALRRCVVREPVGINAVIYAELCLGFDEESELAEALSDAGVRRLALPFAAAWPAARAFEAYRGRGGTRTSALPDFFIGAHALVEGLTLLTRDAARYRSYFPDVRVIAPAT
jgi:predicted nucleic acid-binding protein